MESETQPIESDQGSDTSRPPANSFAERIRRVSEREQHAPKINPQAEIEKENARRRTVMQNLTIAAGGGRFKDCTFSKYETKTQSQVLAKQACEEYAASIPARIAANEGVVLFGPIGTGKDHLAFAICKCAVMGSGLSVGWINGQDWFGKTRDAMDTATSEESLIREHNADLLVISDPVPPFGNLTQHQATMLYRLVNRRYNFGKPTIATVNVANDAEADQRIGAPTWDRLSAGAWKIFCNWPTHRVPAREINFTSKMEKK